MRTLVLVIIMATAGLYSCKNSSGAMDSERIEPANSGKKKGKKELGKQNNVTYDIIISFISKGEGIDRDLKTKIDAVLKSFNENNKIDLKPEILGWGREGEVDYNFITKNLSTKQKKDLTSQVKEAMGSSDMVFITFNQKSVHKR